MLTPVALKDNTDELSPKEALVALHSASVYPRLNYYLFGSSVEQSLSPALHNTAFKAYGLPHHYRIHKSTKLSDLEELLKQPNFGGASVTRPFKVEIISVLKTLSDDAKAMGAVNTIIPIRKEGKVLSLHGDNTDWIAIRTCVLKNLTPLNAITPQTRALVCGAGGMGRAAIYALETLGVENIFLCNRTEKRARELADHFNKRERTKVHLLGYPSSPWPRDHPFPTVVVSCIPSFRLEGGDIPNFVISNEWLQSRTGGVCVEVQSIAHVI
jgi:shikimate 5-dehydrogenase